MSLEVSVSLLLLRLGLAVTFFLYGSRDLFAWFGGDGLRGTVTYWKERLHIPPVFAVIGVLTEFFGSIAMLLGLLTRPAALGLAICMVVAILKVHWRHGFFLARREGERNGYEYCIALLIMSLALLVGGAGTISLDWLLS